MLFYIQSVFLIIFILNAFFLNIPFVSVAILALSSVITLMAVVWKSGMYIKYNLTAILIIALLLIGSFIQKDIAITVAWALLGLGFSHIRPAILFWATVLTIGALEMSVFKRLSFVYFDPNYSGYWLYLGVLPYLIELLKVRYQYFSRKVLSAGMTLAVRTVALLTLSRSILLAFFIHYLFGRDRRGIAIFIGLMLTPLLLVLYGYLFSDRAGGSDSERWIILIQILTGNVFVDTAQGFNGVMVFSPFRENNLVMLHNTPATWLYLSPYFTVCLFILLFVRGNIFLKLTYIMPLLFISVAPGIFYAWGVISYVCARRLLINETRSIER